MRGMRKIVVGKQRIMMGNNSILIRHSFLVIEITLEFLSADGKGLIISYN